MRWLLIFKGTLLNIFIKLLPTLYKRLWMSSKTEKSVFFLPWMRALPIFKYHFGLPLVDTTMENKHTSHFSAEKHACSVLDTFQQWLKSVYLVKSYTVYFWITENITKIFIHEGKNPLCPHRLSLHSRKSSFLFMPERETEFILDFD